MLKTEGRLWEIPEPPVSVHARNAEQMVIAIDIRNLHS